MPPADEGALWTRLSAAGRLPDRALWGAGASVTLGDLVHGSSLANRLDELRGRSVLVATTDQLTAALALIELDGIARRLVLCPPDLPPPDVPFVIATAPGDISPRLKHSGQDPFVAELPRNRQALVTQRLRFLTLPSTQRDMG